MAAVFTVNTLDDHDDGSCSASDCTLREALNASNINALDNVINFASGLNGVIALTGALPAITEGVTINGPGPGIGPTGLSVARNTGGDYRIFTITTDEAVTISGLGIRNGNLQGGSDVGDGGGIFNRNGATVNLTNVVFFGNHASSGGGLANFGSATLDVTNCSFIENVAVSARGGAINLGNGGALNITDSQLQETALWPQTLRAERLPIAAAGSQLSTV